MSDGEINVDSIDGEVSTSANIVGQLYPQGEKGDKGDPGNDGFSPTVTTEKVGKTTTITITDAQGEHTATILDGADGQGSGDMRTEVYDINHNGIVDDAEKVNGHTVGTDVPADAVFTDTTYTAGTGIDITNGVITNTQTSAEWGNITGTLSDQTDLKSALDDKADTSSLSSVATSGSYTDLSDKPSIPTKVSDLNNDSGFIDKDVNNLTNYDTSTTVDTKISNSEEVLIGSDSGIKASHELWVDTSDVTPYVNSEISNEYGTAQNLGYSQEYQNAHNVVVSPTTPTTNEKVWIQKGKNLYNKNAGINAYLSASNGNAIANNDHKVSEYIDISNIASLTTSGSEGNGIVNCFYDSSKAFISAVTLNNETTKTMTVPSGAKYIRVTVKNTALNTYQLEVGTSATTYEAYIEPRILVNGNEIYNADKLVTLNGEVSKNLKVDGDIINKQFDLFNDTSGADWKAFLKNKIDFCIANLNTTKSLTSMFINGGWSGVTYGNGIFTKIFTTYTLTWFGDKGTYFCLYDGNGYQYYILGGNSYYTYEEVIGRWTDGKPIYRIVVPATGDNNATQKVAEISNMATLITAKCYVKNGSTTRIVGSVWSGSLGWASQIYSPNGSDITIECGGDFTSFKNGASIYTTIEYTKTTD